MFVLGWAGPGLACTAMGPSPPNPLGWIRQGWTWASQIKPQGSISSACGENQPSGSRLSFTLLIQLNPVTLD